MFRLIQSYFVPIREADLVKPGAAEGDFEVISQDAGADDSPINSLIGISIAAAGTIVTYDHWEDGYEFDLNDPQQSTTLVYGDGNLANGVAPGTNGTDLFLGGESFILQSTVPVNRDLDNDGVPDENLFDASDLISASYPIAVTRAAFPTASNITSRLAGAVEVLATDQFGDRFIAPVGVDTTTQNGAPHSYTDAFEWTAMHIMAQTDGTPIYVDRNDGSGPQFVTTLDAGEAYVVEDVKAGTSVTTYDPATASEGLGVQVDLVTGDEASGWEMRWYSLTPADEWSNDYYTPVFTFDETSNGSSDDGSTQVWLYNPGSSAITVKVETATGMQTPIVVPAGSSVISPILQKNSGTRFFTDDPDDVFFAITQTDTDGNGAQQDWGHPLIPADQLSSQGNVAIGFGNTQQVTDGNSNNSGDVVWVTPTERAVINIDFDGDGEVDAKRTLNRLESIEIADRTSFSSNAQNDNDMSGAIIYAHKEGDPNTPVDIAIAYGQRGLQDVQESNLLDWGTVVVPLPELIGDKTVQLADDADGDGYYSPGDTVTFTINVVNTGRVDLSAGGYIVDDFTLPIFDLLSAGDGDGPLRYLAGTAQRTQEGTTSAIADDASGSAFPFDNGVASTDMLSPGEVHSYTFQAVINDFGDLAGGTTTFTNKGVVKSNTDTTLDDFSVTRTLHFETGVNVEKLTNGVDGATVVAGDSVRWTYAVTSDGETSLDDIVIVDDNGTPHHSGDDFGAQSVDEGGYNVGDTDQDGILDLGETFLFEAFGTAVAGNYANEATVTATPVYSDGTPVPVGNGGGNVSDTDDSSYVGTAPATIGDFVFEDKDGDGIQDAGEQGISGATVKLLNASGAVVDTVNTDANGGYVFTGVLPGNYRVSFERPGGYDAGVAADQGGNDAKDSDGKLVAGAYRTDLFAVSGGETITNIDQGFIKYATIGDLVFSDLDGDGIQDAGEPGVSGVTVILLDGNGEVDRTTTDGDGKYSFSAAPGTYSVKFEAPNGAAFTAADQGGNDAKDSDAAADGSTAAFTVTSGQSKTDVDAGLLSLSRITGMVFEDAEADGLENPDRPIDNAPVTLLDDQNQVVATTTTGADGTYTFENVAPGDYTVSFGKPNGYTKVSPKDQGGDDTIDSDGREAAVTVVAGQDTGDVDQGFYKPVTIGDRVFDDLDGDGIQDDGEPGHAGVTVNLLDGDGNFIATTTTDSEGNYSFSADPGVFRVEFEAPTGTTFTLAHEGDNDHVDSDAKANGRTPKFTLKSGESTDKMDAGLLSLGAIAGRVFEDRDADGRENKNRPIEDATVELLDKNGDVVATTVTDADGNYLFDAVIPGTYKVRFVQPDGYERVSEQDAVPDDTVDSDGDRTTLKTDPILVVNGGAVTDVDQGFYNPAVIGDFVFNDLDGDGRQDDGEPGRAGVTVNLLDEDGQVVDTAVTDADGKYAFTADPGTYQVEFVRRGGTDFTAQNVGNKEGRDSDADPATGRTDPFTVRSGQTNNKIDAGLIDLGSISGNVFEDVEADGIENPDDPIAGATVDLLDSTGTVIKTVTTDANGDYIFKNVAPGDYTVQFNRPDEYAKASPQNKGGDDSVDSDGDRSTYRAPVSVAVGEDVTDVDQGFYKSASIGDRVFVDTNANGVFDKGEKGRAGATVNLLNASGAVVATTTTDAKGFYEFAVDPGTYMVEFEAPEGYRFTQKDVGDREGKDSDADPGTGRTDPILVESGEVNRKVDAGVVADLCSDPGTFEMPGEDDYTIDLNEGHQNGTNGADVILGTENGDGIATNGGENIVNAGGGNDVVNGGNEADLVFGGDGNDIINGNAGNDSLSGGDGDDKIYGAGGDDRIKAGDGDDLVEAGDGNDKIDLGAGNDTVQGEGGDDCIQGGEDEGSINIAPDGKIEVVLGDEIFGNGGADKFEYVEGDGVDFLFDFKAEDGDKVRFYGVDESQVTFVEKASTPYGPAAGILIDGPDGLGGVFFQQIQDADELEALVEDGTIDFIA